MIRSSVLAVFVCAFLLQAGCGRLNEGLIDYRVARAPQEAPRPGVIQPVVIGMPAQAAMPVEMVKRYRVGSSVKIQPDDSITLTLQQACISDFSEGWSKGTRGEIAVVARVVELIEGVGVNVDYGSIKKGRVIYYSEDVRKGGQCLNFSALPLYGPITYHGHPLLIELYIIELDTKESEQVQGLLKALAGAGATAYPPASPVLKVLETLGTELLKGDNNDVEFRYHCVLWPDVDGRAKIPQATLECGNYVFVRKNPKEFLNNEFADKDPLRWDELRLDEHSGRLVTKDGSLDYDHHTYITLQINKGYPAQAQDLGQSYATLGEMIELQRQAGQINTEILLNQFEDAVNAFKAKEKTKSPTTQPKEPDPAPTAVPAHVSASGSPPSSETR